MLTDITMNEFWWLLVGYIFGVSHWCSDWKALNNYWITLQLLIMYDWFDWLSFGNSWRGYLENVKVCPENARYFCLWRRNQLKEVWDIPRKKCH